MSAPRLLLLGTSSSFRVSPADYHVLWQSLGRGCAEPPAGGGETQWVRLSAVTTTTHTMVDPTSDLNEDIAAENASTCQTCGSALTDHPEHRVITWVEDDQVCSAHFCDDSCRTSWSGE